MEENLIKVYVQVDSNNIVTNILSNIESSITGTNIEGWTQIDEGTGDKYTHAQGNYFSKEKPLKDMQGKCNYKLVDGKLVELTDAEKATLFPTPAQQKTQLEILQETVDALVLSSLEV